MSITEDRTVLLFASAREVGMRVSGDGRVSEADAAQLIGLSAGYLKQLRTTGEGPPAFRVGMNGCRITYSLRDLAAWIEARREC